MTAILALVLLCQQEQTALRTEKADYVPAVDRCKQAEALIESDPREAIAKLDEILNNPRVARRLETRLRIEERPSEYTDFYNFLPYQYRGRARLALARKSERAVAERLVTGAVEDFEESVKRGVAGSTLRKGVLSSADLHKAAKAELAKLKEAPPNVVKPPDPPKDPEPEFKAVWLDLLNQRRFREAREYVEKAGTFFTDAKRKEYVSRTEADCRRRLGDLLDKYADNLARTTAAALGRMSLQDLETSFPLPKEGEVCVKLEPLDWAAAFHPVLDQVRRREDALEALFQAAAGAAPLEEKDGRAWFRGSAALAYQLLEPKVRDCVDRSRTAPADERDRLKSRAVALKQRWTALAEGLPAPFRDRMTFLSEHLRSLDDLVNQFPISPDDIKKAGPDLEKSFDADQPDAELERIEKGLGKIHAELGDRLAVESRQQLLTYLLVAASLRHLLAGKDADDISGIQALKAFGRDLKGVGGPVDARRFGVKVVRVLESLTR